MPHPFNSNAKKLPPDEAKAAALKCPGGWVYEIDGRFDPAQPVPGEAIIGVWQVDPAGMITGLFFPAKRDRAGRWQGTPPSRYASHITVLEEAPSPPRPRNPAVPGVFRDMAEYLSGGSVTATLQQAVDMIGQAAMKGVARDLVNWLTMQKRLGTRRPLQPPFNHPPNGDLLRLVEHWPPLAEYLEVAGGRCDFKASISADLRDAIRTDVEACEEGEIMPSHQPMD